MKTLAPLLVLCSSIAGSVAHAASPDELVHRPLTPASQGIASVPAWAAPHRIDADALAFMIEAGNVVQVELPLGPGPRVVAELRRVDVLTDDATVVVAGPGGVETPLATSVSLWTGSVPGIEGSKVFLGISPMQAQGWITIGGTTHLIATRSLGGTPLALAYEQGMLEVAGALTPPTCAGEVVPEGDVTPATTTDEPTYSSRVACRAFRVAIDSDQEFAGIAGGVQNAADYAVILVAATHEIYTSEIGMGLRLSYLRTWSTTDPWDAANTSDQLSQFRSHWRTNMGSVSRASAHMLSGRSLGGGIAYLRAACSNTNGYAVSANLGGSFPFPIQDNDSNWDLMVVAHEWGHQFGSEHTHNSCAYNPVIDGCGLRSTSSSCENGTQDCSVASAQTGSIMSYCHTCSGGIRNMQMTFGPRVIARMTSYVNGLSCSTSLESPVLASTSVSPAGPVCSGTPVTLSAVATGTELRFQWFRNGVRVYGATNATHVVASPGNNERWDVMVYSPCGIVTTQGTPQGITLAVAGGTPTITEQPASVTSCPAGPVEVSVVAAGGGTLAYRWEVRDLAAPSGWRPIIDGPVVIGDATVAIASGSASPTLSLSSISAAWRGSAGVNGRGVRCVVSGDCGGTASVTSGSALVLLCGADLNCDGGVDGSDIDAFFSLWEAGDQGADVNADGGVDGDDVGTFFMTWEAGC
jgi:hypothetical protein